MLTRKKEYKSKKDKSPRKKKTKTPEEIRKQNEALSSISDPNAWTPEREDEWLKQPARMIERRFPPMKKPPHVALQGKRYG